MKLLIIFSIGASAWAQSGLDVPRVGMMIDARGAARVVSGVAGSFVAGDPVADQVVSMACSRELCLLKTGSGVVSAQGTAAAPTGAAWFAIDGTQAYLYFPESRQFAHWHDGQIEFSDLALPGEIVSLRAVQGSLEFAVRRRGRVWIVNANNQTLDALGYADGPVLLLDDGVLFVSHAGLILRRTDGSETSFPLHRIEEMFRMSPGYIEVRAGGCAYAIRIESAQLFLLPEESR